MTNLQHREILLAGLAAVSFAMLVGCWMLITAGAQIPEAEADDAETTAAVAARSGAKEVPSDPKLSVEPADYR